MTGISLLITNSNRAVFGALLISICGGREYRSVAIDIFE